jgi:hypothetical protein
VFHSKNKETRMVRIRQRDELALPERKTTRPSYVASTAIPVTRHYVLQVTSRREIVSNNMLRRFVARATERRDLERTHHFFPAVRSIVASLRKIRVLEKFKQS